MASTYILKCDDGSYYVGSTIDINKRQQEHQEGRSKFTKSRLPIVLVYKKDFKILSEARKEERKIKHWKSRKAVERLIKSANGPII
ncbi:MAG: GIY-YIG nuclease family protein [Patescibacteria group bacterium]